MEISVTERAKERPKETCKEIARLLTEGTRRRPQTTREQGGRHKETRKMVLQAQSTTNDYIRAGGDFHKETYS